jgi:AhpD family alkylhydroperoxidase
MTARLNPYTAAPEMMNAFMALSTAVETSGLEKPLLELVKIRASQINGCANCLNMHTYEARQAGETEQRIALLSAWEDAPAAIFTPRERAALDWTDHLTQVAVKRAPAHVYEAVEAQFSKEEAVKLTMVIVAINGWNRIAVGFDLFFASYGWK